MRPKSSLVLGVASLLLVAIAWGRHEDGAMADQGGAPWGLGQTYQSTWHGDCQWYDTAHDFGGPYGCWQSVWSDTTATYGDNVTVYEYALRQNYVLLPENAGTAVTYVSFGASPSSDSGTGYAYTSHYYCGDYSCAWPTNVIGYGYHYGNGAQYIYTESNWGCQYVEWGSFC